MADLVEFLQRDLRHLFDDRGIDTSRYDADVEFEDPLSRYSTLEWYLRNIQVRTPLTPTPNRPQPTPNRRVRSAAGAPGTIAMGGGRGSSGSGVTEPL